MYPIIWTPLIDSVSNIGWDDVLFDDSKVTFSEGLCGNNAVINGGLTYHMKRSKEKIIEEGFSFTTFMKFSESVNIFKYSTGNCSLVLSVDTDYNMSLTNNYSDGTYKTMQIINFSDFVDKWIFLSFIYDAKGVYEIYVNDNCIGYREEILVFDEVMSKLDLTFDRVSLFNTKVYSVPISKYQVQSDYYCPLAIYRFDGTGASDDGLTEYDCSGFVHNVSFENPMMVETNDDSMRPYCVKISDPVKLIPEKASWDNFFVNFWIYPNSTTQTSQPLFDYTTSDGSVFSLSINMKNADENKLYLSCSYSGNDSINIKEMDCSKWYMVSLLYEDSMVKIYVDWEVVFIITNIASLSGGYLYLRPFDGLYSDYRHFLNAPSDSYVRLLHKCSTIMDDKGTVHSRRLTEDTTAKFSYNNYNGFTASNINVSDSIENTMIYDTTSSTLSIKDFSEFG